MRQFRPPEIFLGCFLTIAVFAMGMLFVSSGYAPQSAQNISTPKAPNQSEQSKSPDSDLIGSTWLTKDASGFFTFVLVVVGSLQALFFWYQLGLIRESLAPAKDASKAAADSIKLAEKTSRQQLRAYLFPKFPRMVIFNHGKICVHQMLVKNYGQTPADDVVVISNTDFLDPNPVPFPNLDEPDEISKSTIAPTGEIIFTTETEYPLTIENLENVASGTKAFFVWGQIRYNDAFGRPQTTDFRLRFGKIQLQAGSGVMMICDDGNQAT
jgi:hypothetical protein